MGQMGKIQVPFKHKEGLRTLAESLVQMTCSDFTNFFIWPSSPYKTRFLAEMLRFGKFFEFAN